MALEPAEPRHGIALAQLYWVAGQQQKSRETLKGLIAASPQDQNVRLQTAGFFISNNKPEDAEQELKDGIAAIAKRAGHALNDITSLHPNQAVLVVTHGLVIATLTCLNRKIAFEEIFQHIPHNAQPVVLDWHPDWQTALN